MTLPLKAISLEYEPMTKIIAQSDGAAAIGGITGTTRAGSFKLSPNKDIGDVECGCRSGLGSRNMSGSISGSNLCPWSVALAGQAAPGWLCCTAQHATSRCDTSCGHSPGGSYAAPAAHSPADTNTPSCRTKWRGLNPRTPCAFLRRSRPYVRRGTSVGTHRLP
jgi:hypothetical protein